MTHPHRFKLPSSLRSWVLVLSLGVLGVTAPAYAQEVSEDAASATSAEVERAADRAILAGIGDSLSTHLAISSGLGAEANPLVNTSPAGLIALAGAKWGLVKLVEVNGDMTASQKRTALNILTSAWTGVSVNNLLIALGASGPAALVGLAGTALWTYAYAQEAEKVEQARAEPNQGPAQGTLAEEAHALAWTAED